MTARQAAGQPRDPIGFATGDTNSSGYVLNDPVNFVDPSGLAADTAMDVGFIAYDVIQGPGSAGPVAIF